jgi:hypothetical protein
MVAPVPTPEIVGQINGFWLDEVRAPFAAPPNYQPTGAVLPPVGLTNFHDFICLDLVPVQAGPSFVWLPLSEGGVYTYAHSFGMLYGEPWRFFYWDSQGVPCEYDATYESPIPPASIGLIYGFEAALRARQDQHAMQLHLRLRS